MAVKVRRERQSHRFHSMKTLGKGHASRGGVVYLNVTAMVDMMMVLVIFLVMNFNASGEMLFLSKDIKMAQAEHDPLAAVVAVTTNERAVDDILAALDAGLAAHPRADICRAALAGHVQDTVQLSGQPVACSKGWTQSTLGSLVPSSA